MLVYLSDSFPLVNERWKALFLVGVGNLFLALMSQVAVPLPWTTVPLTLQGFAVLMLAGTLGSRLAFWAVMAYLAEASLGLPVLAGAVPNPLWLLAPRAGYLLGFALAAYVAGKCIEMSKKGSFFSIWFSLAIGEAIILGLGTFWLMPFVGSANAFAMGALPFLITGAIRVSAAASLLRSLVK